MDKEILKKMVEMDSKEVKIGKLHEEVTELRFALQGNYNLFQEVLLEMAQVLFILAQLKSYGLNRKSVLDDMLDKYSLRGEFNRIMDINCIQINDIYKKEYKKNCERLGL